VLHPRESDHEALAVSDGIQGPWVLGSLPVELQGDLLSDLEGESRTQTHKQRVLEVLEILEKPVELVGPIDRGLGEEVLKPRKITGHEMLGLKGFQDLIEHHCLAVKQLFTSLVNFLRDVILVHDVLQIGLELLW
jgi:hypothetical protein